MGLQMGAQWSPNASSGSPDRGPRTTKKIVRGPCGMWWMLLRMPVWDVWSKVEMELSSGRECQNGDMGGVHYNTYDTVLLEQLCMVDGALPPRTGKGSWGARKQAFVHFRTIKGSLEDDKRIGPVLSPPPSWADFLQYYP